MIHEILKVGKEKGYIAAFGEATNPRSQKMLAETFGFEIAKDVNGQPIVTKYKDVEAFKTVPEHIAPECQFMYKFL
ncbi:hypothetical protein D3C71_2054600 [compost metagenome]